jgi:hypothetical protein
METAPLKSFATWARTALIGEVTARITGVLAPGSTERVEQARTVAALERAVAAEGGGDEGRSAIADKVAYTWFNRIVALRFMDANGYTGVGVVSPPSGITVGQPEILADAKRGVTDPDAVGAKVRSAVASLLDGTRRSGDPQGEAYALLLEAYCNHWHKAMPFMFEREGDYTELLIPANLLADDSVLNRAVQVLTPDVCEDVEVIGWLYQFYISERKDEVFAGFKKNKKAGPDEIPAATQLFTPHWIVRYLVENSLGRLWMLNHPSSRIVDQMDYYIAPVDEETDFLKIAKPEELKIIDPACGSGHMLTYAFDLLCAIYEEEGYSPNEIPELILTRNLYGTEIDTRAGILAAFALTMKARGKQRTFFSHVVEPNVCVVEPISFTPAEIDALVTGEETRHEEELFWNRFAMADIAGSLIVTDAVLTSRLALHLDSIDFGSDLLISEVVDRARRAVSQATYLISGYAVVLANPPYMGGGHMSPELTNFAKLNFRDYKSDLFAMFIRRATEFTVAGGYVAMVTMHNWMFLSSFERLRASILSETSIVSMAHLGSNAFDSIPGEVVSTTAFVLRTLASNQVGVFLRLVEGQSEAQKVELLSSAIQDDHSPLRFVARTEDFSHLPGSPITYWIGGGLKSLFASTRLGDRFSIGSGLSTADNARFLRYIWEVSRSSIGDEARDTADTIDAPSRWYLFHKGGEYRKWYGNLLHVVKWERDGEEIKKWVVNNPRDPGTTQWSRRIFNTNLYFKPGIVWSTITTGKPSFRLAPAGTLISNAAGGIFDLDAREPRLEVLGALNSNAWASILQTMNPTVNFSSGVIQAAPLPKSIDVDRVAELCSLAALDWAESETSWEFAESPILAVRRRTSRIRDAFDLVRADWRARTESVRRSEDALNQEVNKLHALGDEVPASVSMEDVTLTCNPAYRYRSSSEDVDWEALLLHDAMRDLVSYSVGCMFGRYSLDEPGLIIANQDATLQNYLAKVPSPTFRPDADNVIPIVDGDWFEDDVVERFRQFLRAAFGEQYFEENLRFITESLGGKTLRDYFVKSFYKDHVQRYKKRPIYWLFSSPQGSFNALIYMHRYTPSTVSTVLNEYLREFQGKLKASLAHAERSNNAKEADRIRKVLLELDTYEHDVLYPLASQNIAIDLDDGVRVNYPKFGAALKTIPGLEATE